MENTARRDSYYLYNIIYLCIPYFPFGFYITSVRVNKIYTHTPPMVSRDSRSPQYLYSTSIILQALGTVRNKEISSARAEQIYLFSSHVQYALNDHECL